MTTTAKSADAENQAIDVKTIAELADRAGSGIDIIALETPIAGVPSVIPVFVDRVHGTVTSVADLFERYRTHPRRRKGKARATTLESFIDLVNRHKTDDSVIFAETDWTKPSLTAVIDYHAVDPYGNADNGQHHVAYDFPLSEEWKAWIAQNNQAMSQADFAEWIENHITELAAPDSKEAEDFRELFGFKVAYPNELQALSRGLAIHAETRVKSNVVLQTGEGEITWEEEHRDTAGNKFVVPGLFILSVAPFFLGDKCRIPVRLRYKIRAGQVVWSFHLYRPDTYITEQVRRDLERAADETGLPQFQGSPEMSA